MTDAGEILSAPPHVLDQEVIARYAAASGDYNPIHLDPVYAATTPFGGTIAHGMLLLAYLGALLERRFGAGWGMGGTLKVRFRVPARPGDTVQARGRIERVEEGAEARWAICALEIVNDRDEVLVSGDARVPLSAGS